MSEDRQDDSRNVVPSPEELGFDPVETRERYATERAKRMRADGNDQYLEVAGEFEGVRPPELFQAIYLALLGKAKGPRAGAFLSVLGVAFVAKRFSEVSREVS